MSETFEQTRIRQHLAYWSGELNQTPERLDLIRLKLSGLFFEALEAAGQLKMEFSYDPPNNNPLDNSITNVLHSGQETQA